MEQDRNEWKAEKKRKKARFTALQNLPYPVKKKRAALRIREFIEAAGWEDIPPEQISIFDYMNGGKR